MNKAQSRLTIVPLTLRESNAFVAQHHRHHKPARGCRFCLGVLDQDGTLRGVCIVGRPVARMVDQRKVCEVVRLATDGTPNACSALYGAAGRVAKAMGFEQIITYTLTTEPGTSLRAAGWVEVGETDGGSWDRPSRERTDKAPIIPKRRWEAA
jgi:hypothetical protein